MHYYDGNRFSAWDSWNTHTYVFSSNYVEPWYQSTGSFRALKSIIRLNWSI